MTLTFKPIELSEADGSPQCGWALCSQLKAFSTTDEVLGRGDSASRLPVD